jgi:protein-tyrosine phosphatase
MAEALLRRRLEPEGDWQVASAGTWGLDDQPASRHAIQAMEERGLDITSHRSRAVDHDIIAGADLALTMTRNHAEALRLEFPDQVAKIHLLSEMKNQRRYDIKDPFGSSLADYRACADELEELIDAGLERIKALATGPTNPG